MEARPLRDLILYCDRPSDTVSDLVRRLNSRRVYASSRRRLRNTSGSLIVNYGTSHPPSWRIGEKSMVLNKPEAVQAAISKVRSYERFKEAGVPTLEYTSSLEEARGWFDNGVGRVLCRRDNSSSGAGIHIAEGRDALVSSDFYAKYFPKTHEYRVHVFKDRVIDITQKKRSVEGSNDASEGSGRTLYQRVVRSLDNGWVHAHENLHLPQDFKAKLESTAIDAVKALGLDFGAVDIIAQFGTKHTDRLYGYAVLEVNTAPGLANTTTVEAYVNAIKRLYEETRQDRHVHVRRRVRKLVPVTFVSRKGNKITRMKYRRVWE